MVQGGKKAKIELGFPAWQKTRQNFDNFFKNNQLVEDNSANQARF